MCAGSRVRHIVLRFVIGHPLYQILVVQNWLIGIEDLPLLFGPFNHSETAKIDFVASNLGHAAIDVKLCARDIAGFVRREE
jgi:hypothetical protein